jgi:hypothetical protein
VKLTLTTYRDGTLTSDSQQRIRSALEAELRRGIHLRHPLFDTLIKESGEAAAKAVAAEAPRFLRIQQIHRAEP